MQYDPYGEVLTSTLPVTLTDRLFTGARFDGTIGLYQMGARWYDPALGRWLQPDTIVPDPLSPQDLNRYTYARNSPLVYIDADGRFPGVDIFFGRKLDRQHEYDDTVCLLELTRIALEFCMKTDSLA